jgi:drug/metabolite transporter (DMT)-like permease
MSTSFLLVIASAFLNAAAQLFVKFAAMRCDFSSLKSTATALFTNQWILSSLTLYGLSFVIWMIALSKLDISTAISVFMLSYILTVLGGVIIFKDPMGLIRVLGVFLIIGGIFLASQNKV